MARNGSRFQALALALASGATVQAGAEQAGVSVRTAFRALKHPKFNRRVRAYRAQMRERIVGQLTEACAEAVKTLRALMNEDKASTARLGAARAVLEHAGRLTETVELEARIAALERDKENANAQELTAAG